MNPITPAKLSRYLAAAGLFLAAGMAAQAQNLVTFQVDMSYQVAKSNFTNGVDVVEARGSFQGWSGGFVLTNNPSAPNPSLYSGTYNVTDAPGTDEAFKFIVDGGAGPLGWESPSSTAGGDRHFTLAGGAQTLPVIVFNDDTSTSSVSNNVTFQVSMTAQIAIGKFIPGTDTVEARGGFQGWSGGFVLTNNPAAPGTNADIYSGTYPIVAPAGSPQQFKFIVDGGTGPLGWEHDFATASHNREFTLSNAPSQILPLVYFNDQAPSATVTNNVTFQVDMSVAVLSGNFVSGSDIIEARGSFQGWSGGFALTNNPSGANSNLYSGTYTVIDPPGTQYEYKFIVDGGAGPLGWENPASTGGNNRKFTLANSPSQILPAVFFNDLSTNDVLRSNVLVTFTVNMTGAVGTDAHVFDPAVDTVFINGVLPAGSFWSWGAFPPAEFQLTNNPVGSSNYSITLNIPAGSPLGITYKYSINGADNEAGFAANHIRYIRSSASAVTLPTDKFGTQLVEPSFGNLTVTKSDATHVLVSWLGLQNVHLQSKASLDAGAWTDHLGTTGGSSTNWPSTTGPRFFRLIKPGS